MCACVCVCVVCVRERERERVCVCVAKKERKFILLQFLTHPCAFICPCSKDVFDRVSDTSMLPYMFSRQIFEDGKELGLATVSDTSVFRCVHI